MIKAVNIHKSYGEKDNRFEVLKGVSLTVQDDDYVVILGASGSGKSTLLHTLSGLEKPDNGSIMYDSEEITTMKEDQLTDFRKRMIGFIFQQYYLLPNLNVDKNVKMGADLVNNRDYRKMIEAVGLGKKMFQYPHELSGGEQQRVSVARALAKNPKVLFLDEPTGALDETTGRMVLDYISQLQAQYHFTVVMVTHNANIADMAKTVIRMNSGKIIETYQNVEQKTAYEIGW